jgi:hypothetical protein
LWWEGCSLARSFGRLFELAKNKLVTVSGMFVLGWGVGGEAWKWRRRLLAWEEELVVECVAQVSSCFLQDGLVDSGYGSFTRLSAIRLNSHMPT